MNHLECSASSRSYIKTLFQARSTNGFRAQMEGWRRRGRPLQCSTKKMVKETCEKRVERYKSFGSGQRGLKEEVQEAKAVEEA